METNRKERVVLREGYRDLSTPSTLINYDFKIRMLRVMIGFVLLVKAFMGALIASLSETSTFVEGLYLNVVFLLLLTSK